MCVCASGAGEGTTSQDSPPQGDVGQGEPAPAAPTERVRRHSSMLEVDDTSDPVRIKCRELLERALKTPRKCLVAEWLYSAPEAPYWICYLAKRAIVTMNDRIKYMKLCVFHFT